VFSATSHDFISSHLNSSEQERHLHDLGIVHDSFNLNDTTNLTNCKSLSFLSLCRQADLFTVDRTLHVCLDKYGLFAVTASLTILRAIIRLVEEENRIWQEKSDEGMPYIQGFKVCLPIFNNCTTTDLLS
jgi:hypothetical protein